MGTSEKRIVFIHNPAGQALETAVKEKFGECVEFMSPERAALLAGEFDALMTIDRKPEPGLFRGTRLKWVHAQSHGFGQLLIPELMSHPATVTNSRGCHSESVAEHVFAMLLGLMRKLKEYRECQAAHKWQRYTMDTLYGKTMCVVGVGSIGSAVARRARAFGMKVVGIDVVPVVCEAVDQLLGPQELDSALAAADVVTICVPFNPTTRNMFDSRRLHMMKPGSYLINIARGGIVDESTVLELLNQGRLKGAGFDVFETEPLPPESPLWDAPNMIVLPHSASQTDLSRRRLVELVVENIRRFLAGEPLINVVKQGAAG